MGEAKLDRTGGRDRSLNLFHAIDLLKFALGLGGLARLGAEAVGKLLKGGNFFLLIFVCGEVLFLTGRLFDDIFIIVTAVPVKFGLRNLHNGAHEFI